MLSYFAPYNSNTSNVSARQREMFSPVFSDHVDPVVLAANTLYRHPVPAGARFVHFSFDGDFLARAGGVTDSIAVPTATATTGLAGELNPAARRLLGGATHILLISETARKGSLAFYG